VAQAKPALIPGLLRLNFLPHSPITWAILLAVALLGGAINALAGGGMFMVFPSLLFAGMAPISANATATVTLMPGAWASTLVYRDRLALHGWSLVGGMAVASAAGGWIGSELLLHTSNAQFARLVPWLMFAAALIFTFAGKVRKLAASHHAEKTRVWPLVIGQFFLSIYGGYFGAGMGVIMLALFMATANMDVQTASGIRIMCGSVTNLVAAIIFAVRGIIEWRLGLPMLVCAIAGGTVGAILVKRLNEDRARNVILVYAWSITLWSIARTYF
jgi:uncharacterized protein